MLTLFQRIVNSGLIVLFAVNVFAAGGENGNGMPILDSQLGGFSLAVPRNWDVLTLDRSASLTNEQAQVSIVDRNMPQATSQEQLLSALRAQQPQADWQPTQLAGHRGFESTAANSDQIVLLRATGRVLSVNIRQVTSDIEKEDVGLMLQSLTLK